MTILLTGGAGFIGSHIADAYLAAGHDVIVVDDLSSGFREHVNPNVRFVELDVREPRLEKIFREERIEVVSHHAAQMDVRNSVADPLNDASINVLGSLNLYECARKHGTEKIIFASTGGAIYGEQERFPAEESHPTRPASPYGVAKLANEKYLDFYAQTYGLTTVALRYANVYGPRQNPRGEAGVVAIFIERLLRGAEPVVYGDGLQTRDYVFVEDVVGANLLALGARSGGTFNVGTGVETTVLRILEEISSAIDSAVDPRHAPERKGEQRRSVCDSQRIRDAWGWEPRVGLREGILRTLESVRGRE